MPNTTWSTTDKTAGVALSNLNLTINSSATGGARSADSMASGLKYYWEDTVTNWNGSAQVGIATGRANLATVSNPGINACVVIQNGSIYSNGVQPTGNPTLGARSNNDVIGHALDLTGPNAFYWARLAPTGNWNGSATANPATGVGGIDVSSFVSLGLPPFALAAFGSAAAALTANYGDTAFTGAVPSGFTSGIPTRTAPATNFLLSQAGIEAFAAATPRHQLTQLGLEAWIRGLPIEQLTQLGIEVWGTTTTINTQLELTQIGLEVWAKLAPAITPQARVIIMA